MRTRTFTSVGWEKYLVPTNPFVENFLDKNGDDVFWQIAQNIHNAIKTKKESLAFVVHVNAAAIVVIEKKDYSAVLDECTNWFVKKEEYEKCAKIEEFKSLLNNKSKIRSRDAKLEKTLI